jgi:RHS repeat-associated protein
MFSLPAFVHAAAITITEDNNASFLVNKYMYGTGWSYHTSTSPAHGTVTNSSVEVVTYKPNLNYCGSDQFKFTAKKRSSGGGPINLNSIGQSDTDLQKTAVSDNNSATPLIAQKSNFEELNASYTYSTVTINVTINCVNDTPTITNVSNQSTNEDVAKTVNFTVTDVETADGSLAVTRSTSNSTLLPVGNIVLGGSGSNRTVRMTPVANKSGTATVTLTVKDGSNATRSDSFVLSVNAQNDSPTISSIGRQTISRGSSKTVSFTVSDVETSADNLVLSVTSSNSSIINSSEVTFSGTGSNRTATIAPDSDSSGDVTLTISVSDNTNNTSRSFAVYVEGYWASLGGAADDAAFVEPTYNMDSNSPVGSLTGKAGVSGGQASYSIPIMLPPGRANMQPEISVNYSSQGANGPLGMGFSLSTGGAISRCAKTVAQDGYLSNPTFSVSDALCLNGTRLILTSGTQGATNSEYKTEIDQFASITLKGGSSDSETSYFDVIYKSGKKARYGSSNYTAEVVFDGHVKSQSWLLNYESDATLKNFIHYYYVAKGDGEVVLDSVRYTGASATSPGDRIVEFDYNTSRPDARSGYSYGGHYENSALLEKITTKISSSTVHKYHFSYRQSAATGRSILETIEQCDSDNNCFPATEFDWQDAAFSYDLERLTVNGDAVLTDKRYLADAMPYGDINGDGAVDWPGYFVDADGNGSSHNFTLNRCSENSLRLRRHCISADFNNDGLTDGWSIDSSRNLQLIITQGDVVNTNIILANAPPYDGAIKSDHIVDVRDYDGDGNTDLLIYQYIQGAIKLQLYKHTGNLSSPYSSTSVQTVYTYTIEGSTPNKQIVKEAIPMGDMDGNGLPDLVEVEFYASLVTQLTPVPKPNAMLLNTGTSFSVVPFNFGLPATSFNTNFYSQFIDINGDGLDDWIGFSDESDPQKSLAVNLGGGNFGELQDINVSIPMRTYRLFDDASGDWITRRYPKFQGGMKVHDIDMNGVPELLIPGDALLESCARVSQVNVNGSVSTSTKCGDDLYTAVRTNANSNATTPLSTSSFDNGVYKYNAYSFSKQSNGLFTASLKTTELVGNAYESAIVDAYGDGFSDLIFVLGVRSAGVTCPSESEASYLKHSTASGAMAGRGCEYGVYVNRNRGSATGNEDYAATDVIYKVTNGLGASAKWDYKPLSSSEFDGAANLALYGVNSRDVNDSDHIHFSSSMYVVRSFQESNGLNGFFENLYAYRGAMFNNKGRGFRGFRSIISENLSTGLVTQTDFRQKFPFSSTLQGTHTFKTSDYQNLLSSDSEGKYVSIPYYDYSSSNQQNIDFSTAISTSLYQWSVNDAHWGMNNNLSCQNVWNEEIGEFDRECIHSPLVHSIYQKMSSNINRDLTNSSTIISESEKQITDIDGYGNILSSVQQYSDDYGTRKVDVELTYSNEEWGLVETQKTTTSSITSRNATDPLLVSGRSDLDAEKWVQNTYSNYHTSRQPGMISSTNSDGSSVARTQSVNISYNDYGLPVSKVATASVMNTSGAWSTESRFNSIAYSSNNNTVSDAGYFPYKLTNSLNQVSYIHTDYRFGSVSKNIDANGLSHESEYDAMGRLVAEKSPSKPWTYLYIDSSEYDTKSPQYGVWKSVIQSAGAPDEVVFYDALNRNLRASTQGFDGSWINTDTAYNDQGHLIQQSLPFGTGNKGDTSLGDYDALGRPGYKEFPSGLRVDYSYSGLDTDIDAGGLAMQRTYSGKHLMQTEDANGNYTRYAYNAMGLPVIIKDAASNNTYATYNALGQKIKLEDPNQGTTTFSYNGFGELEQEINSNGQTIRHDYDKLGRKVSQKSYVGSSLKSQQTYSFDTNFVGLPYQRVSDGVIKTFDYTAKGQLNRSQLNIDGNTFTTDYTYDGNYGRLKSTRYPNTFTLEQQYNSYGYPKKLLNASSDYVYQQIDSMDDFFNVTQSTLGNGVIELAVYDEMTGLVESISAKMGSNTIHNLSYLGGYDDFGNLLNAYNLVTSAEESYTYDNLHRLKSSTYSGWGGSDTINYTYDEVGNIQSKSDYASQYRYGNANRSAGGNAGSNAVRQVVKANGLLANLSYDNMGNLVSGDGISAVYNSFKQPTKIVRNGTTFNFTYDADLQRVKEVRGSLETFEIDQVYEKRSDGSWTLHIGGVATLNYNTTSGHSLLYRHKDRLGSAVTFSDSNGIVGQNGRRFFDPFGKPRDPNGSSLAVSRLPYLNDINLGGRKGFTDHRHLDEAQLIHMNGRVYDYNLGRFLSVDPFIQSPTNSQSVNPYSYIMNNPLAGTDPTGYKSEKIEKRAVTGSRIKRNVTTVGNSITSSSSNVKFNGSIDTNSSNSRQSTGPTNTSDIGGQQEVAKQSGKTGDNSTNVDQNASATTVALPMSAAAATAEGAATRTSLGAMVGRALGLGLGLLTYSPELASGTFSEAELATMREGSEAIDEAYTLGLSSAASQAESHRGNNVAVIGQGQVNRVIPYAKVVKGISFSIPDRLLYESGYMKQFSSGVQEAISVSFNRGWINGVMNAKYQIHDVGFARGRDNVPGPWYGAELQEVARRNYPTYKVRIK